MRKSLVSYLSRTENHKICHISYQIQFRSLIFVDSFLKDGEKPRSYVLLRYDFIGITSAHRVLILKYVSCGDFVSAVRYSWYSYLCHRNQ